MTFARYLEQGPPQAQAQPVLEWTVGRRGALVWKCVLTAVVDEGDEDWGKVLVGLCDYVSSTEFPEPLVVYRLGRSREERAMDTLLDLLRRTAEASDEASQHLAYQALVALSDFPEMPAEAVALGRRSSSEHLREYALSVSESP